MVVVVAVLVRPEEDEEEEPDDDLVAPKRSLLLLPWLARFTLPPLLKLVVLVVTVVLDLVPKGRPAWVLVAAEEAELKLLALLLAV